MEGESNENSPDRGSTAGVDNGSYETDDERERILGRRRRRRREGAVPCYTVILSVFCALGGFLFGYDTGVVSGAMLLLTDVFSLSTFYQTLIVSVTVGFAGIASLLGGFLNDRIGRRPSTIAASLVFTVGAALLGAADSVLVLVVGRSVVGIGIGLASSTVPIYIAECAPAHLRGQLVTLNNLFITGGQFVSTLMSAAFSYNKENGWRYMLGIAGIPSIIQFIGFMFLPESPRWLISEGRVDEAGRVLVTLRGTKEVDEELWKIKKSYETQANREKSDQSFTLVRILNTPYTRRALIVGCSLQLFQQLSGINTVMYYSATIIKMSGIKDETQAIWLASLTAAVNFLFTLVGLWLVDRVGRRKLTLGSLAGVFVSLVVLAVGFQIVAMHSPAINRVEQVAEKSSCSHYQNCEKCVEDTKCGYCYDDFSLGPVNGTCLPALEDSVVRSALGRCNKSKLVNPIVWAYNYCPTPYAWVTIFGLVLYLIFFAPGMGPVPWTVNAEIYPMWARGTANSVSTAVNWISNLLVSMLFLELTVYITKYGTYWLMAGISLIGFIFLAVLLPETKGRKLEEVEEIFSQPLCRTSRIY